MTAAAAAKSLQSRPTLCDPIDGSPPGSPSLGFSRQEPWSGLPFPSPMHESEKWKWSRSVVSDSCQPHGLQPTRLLCPWDLPGKRTGVGNSNYKDYDKGICFKCLRNSNESSVKTEQSAKNIQVRNEEIREEIFMETHKTLNASNNLEKEEQSWRYRIPWFQTILQSLNSMVLTQKQTHRSTGQNREPRNEPHLYGQLIYNKGGMNTQWGKDSHFNNCFWENWTTSCKRITLEYSLKLCIKINSKSTKD